MLFSNYVVLMDPDFTLMNFDTDRIIEIIASAGCIYTVSFFKVSQKIKIEN